MRASKFSLSVKKGPTVVGIFSVVLWVALPLCEYHGDRFNEVKSTSEVAGMLLPTKGKVFCAIDTMFRLASYGSLKKDKLRQV